MKLLAVFLLFFSMMAKVSGDQRVVLLQRFNCCPSGWTPINGRCFRYVAKPLAWIDAEKNCQSMGGNLASVHNMKEYHQVQALIRAASRGSGLTWLGGSDAQKDRTWLWSDGSPMLYKNWCKGEPNNWSGRQPCLQMNWSDAKCWDDAGCPSRKPSVCARTV